MNLSNEPKIGFHNKKGTYSLSPPDLNYINENNYLSNYIIGDTLGKGTFGKVKLATHKITKEKVAIKFIEKAKLIKTIDKQRINREIKILKNTFHYNIIKIYQVIETKDYICIITEYAEGGELFKYILEKKHLSEEESRNIFQQIIDAVSYLHKIGVCHRDLKPENILLSKNKKHIKIIDFGLSNLYLTGVTSENPALSFGADFLETPCGSPGYAPPEMILGCKYDGLLSDIWSCGVILYAMLFGSLPFDDICEEKLYSKIIKGDFGFPENIIVSDDVKILLKKILVVNPRLRATIKDIRADPWFMKNYKIIMGLYISIREIPICENIVDEMCKYGFNKENIIENVKNNRHNEITTFYYLLVQKYSNMGIETKSDLYSKEFNEYLNEQNLKNELTKKNEKPTSLKIMKNESKPLFDLNDTNNNSNKKKNKESIDLEYLKKLAEKFVLNDSSETNNNTISNNNFTVEVKKINTKLTNRLVKKQKIPKNEKHSGNLTSRSKKIEIEKQNNKEFNKILGCFDITRFKQLVQDKKMKTRNNNSEKNKKSNLYPNSSKNRINRNNTQKNKLIIKKIKIKKDILSLNNNISNSKFAIYSRNYLNSKDFNQIKEIHTSRALHNKYKIKSNSNSKSKSNTKYPAPNNNKHIINYSLQKFFNSNNNKNAGIYLNKNNTNLTQKQDFQKNIHQRSRNITSNNLKNEKSNLKSKVIDICIIPNKILKTATFCANKHKKIIKNKKLEDSKKKSPSTKSKKKINSMKKIDDNHKTSSNIINIKKKNINNTSNSISKIITSLNSISNLDQKSPPDNKKFISVNINVTINNPTRQKSKITPIKKVKNFKTIVNNNISNEIKSLKLNLNHIEQKSQTSRRINKMNMFNNKYFITSDNKYNMVMRKKNLKTGNIIESEQFFNTNIKNVDEAITNIKQKMKINVTKKENKYTCVQGKNKVILELFEINGPEGVQIDIKNIGNTKECNDLKKSIFGMIKGYFCD